MKKKIIVWVASIVSLLSYGMESNKQFSFLVGDTELRLIKAPLYDALKYTATKNVDVVCAGRKEQRMLQEPDFGDSNRVGEIYTQQNRLYYHESFSTDKFPPYKNDSQLYKTAVNQTVDTTVTKVWYLVEPTLRQSYDSLPLYFAQYDSKNIPNRLSVEYLGQEALTESAIDLELCFTLLLEKVREASVNSIEAEAVIDSPHGLSLLSEKAKEILGVSKTSQDVKKSTVLLQILSAHVGLSKEEIAPIMTKAILDYLRKHSTVYAYIGLCVYSDGEFDYYRSYLQDRVDAFK